MDLSPQGDSVIMCPKPVLLGSESPGHLQLDEHLVLQIFFIANQDALEPVFFQLDILGPQFSEGSLEEEREHLLF